MPGGLLRGAFAGLLDVLLPPVCALCGQGAPADALGLCPACLGAIAPLSPPACPVCALPFAGAGPSHPCAQCLKKPPPFQRAAVYGRYEGSLKDAVVAFKYGKNLFVRAALEGLFLNHCREVWGERPDFSAVVTVPCHPRTLHRRGLDLPALLARRAALAWKLPWRPDALQKTRDGVHMAALGLDKRREAARTLFAPRRKLSGKVLLVDDVVTTTASLRAAARACLAAGAGEVEAAALARTPLDRPPS